jgi:hypothetical protein
MVFVEPFGVLKMSSFGEHSGKVKALKAGVLYGGRS